MTIATLDRAVEHANVWVKDVAEEMGWTDRNKALQGLRVVLHVLRDRLTQAEVVQLGAQLPLLIRGIYYEGWKPSKPVIDRTVDRFLLRVAHAFEGRMDFETKDLVRAVFAVLSRRVDAGEIGDIRSILPKGFDALWPAE